jgi:excisionase family DNA binding protein
MQAETSSSPQRLTVRQCVERHRISRQAILRAIDEGRLPARKVGSLWAITEADCAAYQPTLTAAERGRRRGWLPRKQRERQRRENPGVNS